VEGAGAILNRNGGNVKMEPTYEDLIAFHGHGCPGLAIGYRMSQAALASLAESRAADEEIVVEVRLTPVKAMAIAGAC